MKKFFNFIKNKANAIFSTAKTVLSRSVAEGYIDTGVKIIIGVVIGGVILAGLYTLFSGIVDTTLPTRIEEMFNYAG